MITKVEVIKLKTSFITKRRRRLFTTMPAISEVHGHAVKCFKTKIVGGVSIIKSKKKKSPRPNVRRQCEQDSITQVLKAMTLHCYNNNVEHGSLVSSVVVGQISFVEILESQVSKLQLRILCLSRVCFLIALLSMLAVVK